MVANAVVTDWSGSANTGWPQEPTGMLMPGQVQGWPAGTQRAANAAQRLLSQAVAWWDVGQYRDGDRFLRNRGTGGELLDLRLGSSIAANSNDPKFLETDNAGYVYLPGGSDLNAVSVPNEAALNISGDLDLRAEISWDSFPPSSVQPIIQKRLAGGTQPIGYQMRVTTSGNLLLTRGRTNNTTATFTSSEIVPARAGERLWVRATQDVDNGAGGTDCFFYTSTDNGSTWTQLGTTQTINSVVAANTSSTDPVYIGYGWLGLANGTTSGKVYRAVIKDGIDGTTVLDVDCDAITSGSATSFTAVTNQTVTISRSTSGRKSVAVPSRHKGGKPVMLFGTDDYLEIPAENGWQHGLLNFAQGDSFTVLAVVRQWGTIGVEMVLSKSNGIAATMLGYIIFANLHNSNRIGDGTTRTIVNDGVSLAGTIGNVALRGMIRVPSSARSIIGSTLAESVVDNSRGSVNPSTFRLGGLSSSDYANMELTAAAVFRRALTAAEVTTLNTYFGGN